jgi:hypothetical protein
MAADWIVQSAAERFAGLGLTLVPMHPGRDAPALAGWNRNENLVVTAAQARTRFGLREYNVGIDLHRSGLAQLEVTHPTLVAGVLDTLGTDLSRLLDHRAVADGPRPEQRRALFRLRPGQTFTARTLTVPAALAQMFGADVCENGADIEVGCLHGGPLDSPVVVPPSVDQSRGCRYRWVNDSNGPARLDDFPFLLEQLAALSTEWDTRVEAALQARMGSPAQRGAQTGPARRRQRDSVWVERIVGVLVERQIAGRSSVAVEEVMAAVRSQSGKSKSWSARTREALNTLIAAGLVRIVSDGSGQWSIEMTEEMT